MSPRANVQTLPSNSPTALTQTFDPFRVRKRSRRVHFDGVWRLLRAAVGPDIPVHAAGGVANRMTPDELKAFVDAVTDEGTVTGWSLYDFQTTGPKGWAALAPLGTG